MPRPCTDTLYRDLAPRPCTETLYRDLVPRPCAETLCRDLVMRPCAETLYRDQYRARVPAFATADASHQARSGLKEGGRRPRPCRAMRTTRSPFSTTRSSSWRDRTARCTSPARRSIEGGALIRPDGGVDIDTIRAYVASRLHLIPRYRQRLAFLPMQGRPIWVDDAHFNIHYHVRHTALPRPGDERQLKRLAARIMAQHLDRSKPLWEIWIVEGLEGRRPLRDDQQDPSLHGRRRVERRSAQRAACSRCRATRSRRRRTGFRARRRRRWTSPARRSGSVAHLPSELGRGVQRALRDVQDPRSDLRARVRALRDTFGSGMRTRVGDSAQPAGRTAPAVRLVQDGSRHGEGGEERPRRHAQRRRARHRLRRRAPLPGAPSRQRRDARLPRHGAGQRAQRGRARYARQPRLRLDGAAAARPSATRARCWPRSARPPAS